MTREGGVPMGCHEMNGRPTKKLTEFVTVRLDADDLCDLAIMRRARENRDNGSETTDSLVVRDLIRYAIAVARARGMLPAT